MVRPLRSSGRPETLRSATLAGMDHPVGYLITFSCYGSRLPGDERGAVDRTHNAFGSAFRPPDKAQQQRARARLRAAPEHLPAAGRGVVEQAIRSVCAHNQWQLYALNARCTHVHVVV